MVGRGHINQSDPVFIVITILLLEMQLIDVVVVVVFVVVSPLLWSWSERGLRRGPGDRRDIEER